MTRCELLSIQLISLLDGDLLPLPTMDDLDRNEERIAIAVRDYAGLPLDRWDALNKCSREPWLEKTIALVSSELATDTQTEQQADDPKVPPLHRLAVDEARKTITLDGTTHEVKSVLAIRWVRVLAAHPGQWISGTDLEGYEKKLIMDSEDAILLNAKTNRLKRFLPTAIQSIIDSQTGAGSRIRL